MGSRHCSVPWIWVQSGPTLVVKDWCGAGWMWDRLTQEKLTILAHSRMEISCDHWSSMGLGTQSLQFPWM